MKSYKLTTKTEAIIESGEEFCAVLNGLRKQNVPEKVLSDLVTGGIGVWNSGHVVTTYKVEVIKESE